MSQILRSDVSAKAAWEIMRGDDFQMVFQFPASYDLTGSAVALEVKRISGGQIGVVNLNPTITIDNTAKRVTIGLSGSNTSALEPTGKYAVAGAGIIKYAYAVSLTKASKKTTLLCGPFHVNAYEY